MKSSIPSTAPTPIRAREPSEARWLHAIVLLHALAIVLPYAWAALITPQGGAWGGLLYSPNDQNVHLAWARQARDGSVFIRDAFTTENLGDGSRPLFFNALTFLVGILSRLTTLDVVVWYHAARVAAAIAGLYALHSLTKRWSSDWRVRVSTVGIAAFAGGAGWLQNLAPQVLGGRTFIDRVDGSLMMPEAWGFASNFLFALNAAAFWLLCLAYDRLLRAREGDRKSLFVAAGAAFFLSNIHTYDAIPFVVTLFVASFVEFRRSGFTSPRATASGVVVGAAAFPVIWQVLVFRGSEEFRLKALTPTPAPPLPDILLSYSPLLLLAIIGIIATRKNRVQVLEAGKIWPLAWAIVTLAMIYAPVSFARKMIEGLHIPLAFGAALGLVFLLEKAPRPIRAPAAAAALGVLSLSMLNFASWCLSPATWADNSVSRGLIPPLYLAQGDADALKYLDTRPASEKESQAVLCFIKVGSYVPRATGMSTFAGHWAETLHLPRKMSESESFYRGRLSAEGARAWLEKNHVVWILEGQYERGVYGSDVASAYPFLKEAWRGGEAKVFRFTK